LKVKILILIYLQKLQKKINKNCSKEDLYFYFNVTDIQNFLRENKLRSTGKKSVLVREVIEFFKDKEKAIKKYSTDKKSRNTKEKSKIEKKDVEESFEKLDEEGDMDEEGDKDEEDTDKKSRNTKEKSKKDKKNVGESFENLDEEGDKDQDDEIEDDKNDKDDLSDKEETPLTEIRKPIKNKKQEDPEVFTPEESSEMSTPQKLNKGRINSNVRRKQSNSIGKLTQSTRKLNIDDVPDDEVEDL